MKEIRLRMNVIRLRIKEIRLRCEGPFGWRWRTSFRREPVRSELKVPWMRPNQVRLGVGTWKQYLGRSRLCSGSWKSPLVKWNLENADGILGIVTCNCLKVCDFCIQSEAWANREIPSADLYAHSKNALRIWIAENNLDKTFAAGELLFALTFKLCINCWDCWRYEQMSASILRLDRNAIIYVASEN